MMKTAILITVLSVMFICFSCNESGEDQSLFEILDNETIGIDFVNQLEYDKDFNVYKYRNYYNGGGVALGDINNDGWIDIYFTSNLGKNRLYLNNKDNTFKDITDQAGVGGTKYWSTGVTMVDINYDGLLDIYVCNSGDIAGDDKENELFINKGDLTFIESAKEYSLNDRGFSTHALFFDYDKDDDLDVYLLNNSYQAIGSFNLRIDERPNYDQEGGDKLLRNDNGKFVNVTESSGIYGSVIGFGLGISSGDVNNDGWDDLYISNDFFERDYLYINNQDGTFNEVLVDQMMSISGASMGADMADIDNDGNLDIFVTEMLPSDPQRLKTVTTFENWNKYQYNVKNGYHHQFTRNTLQYNNGDGTFSEIGRYAGVEASDWSWGALFFDMNNDGLQDLFVANGIYQDLTNQDYLQYVANDEVMKSIIMDDGVNYKELIDIIPSNPVPNHFYLNTGDFRFERQHGKPFSQNSFSNGSAYGDIDNDGDLDLVVNNVNMPPFIYQNRTENLGGKHVQISLRQDGKNKGAIGAKVTVTLPDGKAIYQHVQPSRGFQSSVDSKLVFGVDNAEEVEIRIMWPDLSIKEISAQPTNSELIINKDGSEQKPEITSNGETLFRKLDLIDYYHKENSYSDFNRERLLYEMRSQQTPKISSGDFNLDGNKDLIVTGAKDHPSAIFAKTEKGYVRQNIPLLKSLENIENTAVCVGDLNGDGYDDIYFGSGGVDISPFSPVLFDNILFNDGKGGFYQGNQKLPNSEDNISTSVAVKNDYDSDGDYDLFVGERVKIGKYGMPCNGYLLSNDGLGNFQDVTKETVPELQNIGMITDAVFEDLDNDGIKELLVVGEFMTLEIFVFQDGQYKKHKFEGQEKLKGWYNTMHTSDLNNDGFQDIILGNHGTNSRFKASEERPIKLYYNDFDNNGFPEAIMTYQMEDGRDYPYALRHDLVDQLKYLQKLFPDYDSYKEASIDQVFSAKELESATVLSVYDTRTKILMNMGNISFDDIELPSEVQFSPIYAIETLDFDSDGDTDIFMGGNQYASKPEAGIYDASYGILLSNEGKDKWTVVKPNSSGLLIKGQIRDVMALDDHLLLIARNNDSLLSYKY